MKTEPKNGIYVPTIDIKDELVNLYLDVIEKDILLPNNRDEIIEDVNNLFNLLNKKQALAYAYFRDNKLIGFTQIVFNTLEKRKHVAEKQRVLVHPDYQNFGYGIKLLKKIQNEVSKKSTIQYIVTETIVLTKALQSKILGYKFLANMRDYLVLNNGKTIDVDILRWDNPNYKAN